MTIPRRLPTGDRERVGKALAANARGLNPRADVNIAGGALQAKTAMKPGKLATFHSSSLDL